MDTLKTKDYEVFEAIQKEMKRQSEGIELIASENYVSKSVLEAMGTVLTNKYSEGYPGKRYYEGNIIIDEIENLAIERAKSLFSAEHVNIQPLSGSPANAAVYLATLNPGDKVLGLSLDHGGHLSHGHPVNFSGILFDFIKYEVEKNNYLIDMDKVEEIALKEKPKMIIAGFSAYSRALDWKRFKNIATKIDAITFADISHIAGLIAGKQIENPVPLFDIVSTTTHKTLRGPRGAIIMCKQKYAQSIDKAVFPGMQGGPHDHINAAKAVAFKEALQPEFVNYANQVIVNAKKLCNELQNYGFNIISGGTDNHLMLIDLSNKNITGKKATHILELGGISTNMNMIPYDKRSPMDPSGLRIGTPAVTTRGMKEKEMVVIARWIKDIIDNPNNTDIQKKVKSEVKELCSVYKVPGI